MNDTVTYTGSLTRVEMRRTIGPARHTYLYTVLSTATGDVEAVCRWNDYAALESAVTSAQAHAAQAQITGVLLYPQGGGPDFIQVTAVQIGDFRWPASQ